MAEKVLKETLVFPTGKVPKRYMNEHQSDTGKQVFVFIYETPVEAKITVVKDEEPEEDEGDDDKLKKILTGTKNKKR